MHVAPLLRRLPRALALGALLGACTASSASAANSAFITLSPNKGGTATLAAPTTFKVTALTPDAVYDPTGATRIKAIQVNLPEQLLFNTVGFAACDVKRFLETKICSAKSKIGVAVVEADGGPEIGLVQVITDLYYGEGFAILARIQSNSPAIIDQPVIGSLRSSTLAGHGMQMYIPVPPDISEPIEDIYPVVRSIVATVRPPTRLLKVPGKRKKVRLSLAGLAPCNGPLNFNISVVYTDSGLLVDKAFDGADTTARCRR